MKKIVIESPLSGDFQKNFRYLLWCCRAVWLKDRAYALASHMINPWFMDDLDPAERESGIDNPWVWDPRDEHWFFLDLGLSFGMQKAWERIGPYGNMRKQLSLATYNPEAWEKFEAGEWPPHTPGFELKS